MKKMNLKTIQNKFIEISGIKDQEQKQRLIWGK